MEGGVKEERWEVEEEDKDNIGEERWKRANRIKTGSSYIYSSNFTSTLSPPPLFSPSLPPTSSLLTVG